MKSGNGPEWSSPRDCKASSTMVGSGLEEACPLSASVGYGKGARKPRIALFSGNYNYLRDGANQALNRLVVCADTPSARNLVAHGETGFLCASVDPDAYVSTAIELLRTPARRAAIGVAARRASLGHGWDTALEDVLAVYREALALLETRTCSPPFQRRKTAKPKGSDHFEQRIDRK
jgi:hypothetical protein